jgi:hypothetical protein
MVRDAVTLPREDAGDREPWRTWVIKPGGIWALAWPDDGEGCLALLRSGWA